LGDGTTTDSPTPLDVRGLTSVIIALAAGYEHTCALTAGGGVKCWGWNQVGQLGDGTTTDRLTPVDVSGLTGVNAISAGGGHTCALTAAGGVKCWGNNWAGQLGDGTTTNHLTPVDVRGLASGVIALTAGINHTCALTAVGGVKCWGSNGGKLGDGTTSNRLTPVDVSGLSNGVIAIVSNVYHTCALMAGGGVKCWGKNDYGQLGDGSKTDGRTPVDVSGISSAVTALAVGYGHTCALTALGTVECWGWNTHGQLGDGTTTDRLMPVTVSEHTSGFTTLMAGDLHTCALTATGGIKCWGYNEFGELGDGTTADRLIPVDVIGFGGKAASVSQLTPTPTLTYENEPSKTYTFTPR
jgi:alpha-tubulin suppressor-like RCC1 family protein